MGYRRRFTWEVAALCPHAIFYRYVNSVFMNACIQSLARVHLYLLQLYFTCIIITSEKRPLIQNAIFQKFFLSKAFSFFTFVGILTKKVVNRSLRNLELWFFIKLPRTKDNIVFLRALFSIIYKKSGESWTCFFYSCKIFDFGYRTEVHILGK